MEDAIGKVDAAVADKPAPGRDQACLLLRGIGAFEVFIHHRPYGVDG